MGVASLGRDESSPGHFRFWRGDQENSLEVTSMRTHYGCCTLQKIEEARVQEERRGIGRRKTLLPRGITMKTLQAIGRKNTHTMSLDFIWSGNEIKHLRSNYKINECPLYTDGRTTRKERPRAIEMEDPNPPRDRTPSLELPPSPPLPATGEDLTAQALQRILLFMQQQAGHNQNV
ncbi:hypothetical protein DH2020_045706 [Rehmannia glutinosa]|uniref:Uncharacterized protein n=1 Tax=Rehmannia glutinosa TaxID=99300 RepID=A0ABR0UE10_REHGL